MPKTTDPQPGTRTPLARNRLPLLLACLALTLTMAAQDTCQFTIAVTPPTCPGDQDGVITLTPLVPSEYHYAWSHDATLDAPVATGLAAGPYEVAVVDTAGCFLLIDTVVPVPVSPALGTLTTTNISCAGADDGSVTLTVDPGPYTWFWTDAPAITATTRTDLGPGVYSVVIQGGTCPSTLYALLGNPGVHILGESQYCLADPPVLTGDLQWGFDPDLFFWSTGDTVNPIQVQPGFEGEIQLVAVDTMIGCADSSTITLTLLPGPEVEYSVPDSLCMKAPALGILIDPGAADSLVWRWGSDGFSNEDFPSIVFFEPGWQPVSLTGYDSDGCGGLPRLDSIYSKPPPPATFTAEQIPCTALIQLQFNSPNADSCAFLLDNTPILGQCYGFHELDAGRYRDLDLTFFTSDAQGCSDTTRLLLEMRIPPAAFLPNAFTPNGDDINDTWPGPLDLPDPRIQLEVTDRWGNPVWQANSIYEKWDGGDLPMGVYVYHLRMRNPCNPVEEIKKNGFVTLFR